MVCWQCPLLGRQLALQIDVGRNEKKGCVAGEAMHRNEWKYMLLMCCNEWCSFQGPSPTPPGGATTSLSLPVDAWDLLDGVLAVSAPRPTTGPAD